MCLYEQLQSISPLFGTSRKRLCERMTTMNYLAKVIQAIPGDNYTVIAYFADGTIHQVDMKPYIEKGGVFSCLADKTFFADRLTVLNGTVAWDKSGTRDETTCIDVDPCVIYEKSKTIKDPLQCVSSLHKK